MKKKLSLMLVALSAIALLAGCEPLTVFNPKGPNAETLLSYQSYWDFLFAFYPKKE